jgi:transposase
MQYTDQMDEKKNQEPKDWREARRLQAWALKQKGWKQKDSAEALGVSKGAVSQWFKKANSEGVEALRKRKGGGPKPRLSAEQVGQLPALLRQGAEHFGFRGNVWTRARVATVIQQTFGVAYSRTHVGWLLEKIGWSRQKPLTRAGQRDEGPLNAGAARPGLKCKKSQTGGTYHSVCR